MGGNVLWIQLYGPSVESHNLGSIAARFSEGVGQVTGRERVGRVQSNGLLERCDRTCVVSFPIAHIA